MSLHLDGRPVRSVLGFLPLPSGVPMGICLNSYNNDGIVTVTAEQYAVRSPMPNNSSTGSPMNNEQLKRNAYPDFHS